jgi:hypothetical protein
MIHDPRAVFLLDVIARRILGDRGDALEQQIGALFSRARTSLKSPLQDPMPRLGITRRVADGREVSGLEESHVKPRERTSIPQLLLWFPRFQDLGQSY